jgi:hypothetical protein
MRFAYPLLFILLAIISASTWISSLVFADPKDEAITFLTDIESGKLAKTVKHFGGNACRCPAKGGWGAYLIYQSGQEPNLAFMTGHDFAIGKPTSTKMENTKSYLVPWERPEDSAVDVPISFDAARYSPVFLPLPMAYGKKMTEEEFDKFLQDPDKDSWKGFTLRFRPSIKPGSIAPPTEPLPPEAATEFEALQKDGGKHSADTQPKESTDDAIKEALGDAATDYLHPAEAGPVVRADGSTIPWQEVESKLPRLKNTILRLHVVRRGQIKDWTIYHFGLMDPVLVEGGKEIHFTHDRRPS